jgi:hypothetical protein
MPTFLVERFLPAATHDRLHALATASAEIAAQLRAEGIAVHYHESTLLAGEESCLCLFSAPTLEAVQLANDRAGLEYERIVEAVHVHGTAEAAAGT